LKYKKYLFLLLYSAGDDMAQNMSHRYKWWLLKNGKILYYSRIVSIFLFILLLIVLVPLLFAGKVISFTIAIVLVCMFSVIVVVVHISSDYRNLYRAIERLSENFSIKTINLIRAKVTIEDERARRYVIKFCRFWGEPDLQDFSEDPEHYEIWTPLRKSLHPESSFHTNSGIIAALLGFFLPHTKSWDTSSDTVLEENVKRLVHLRYENEAKAIPSLRVVKLAEKQGGSILLAMLTKSASSVQINKTMNLLKALVHEIEH